MVGSRRARLQPLGDSSVLHHASYLTLKNHIIQGMSAHAFREYGIDFQSMDQVKWYNGLSPVNKQGDLYFLLHNFGEQIVSFKLEKLKRDIRKGKKVNLKAYTKPVTRGCKLWLWKERLTERFESMSFKFAASTKSGSDRTGSDHGWITDRITDHGSDHVK